MQLVDSVSGDYLIEALRGWHAKELLPDIDYDAFCQQYLMKPTITGMPPQRVSLCIFRFFETYQILVFVPKSCHVGTSSSRT